MFCGILPDRRRGRRSWRDCWEDLVNVIRTTPNRRSGQLRSDARLTDRPFLMSEDIATNFFFFALDKFNVSQHAVLPEFLRKLSYFDHCQPRSWAEWWTIIPVVTAPLCNPAREISWRTKLVAKWKTCYSRYRENPPFFRKVPNKALQSSVCISAVHYNCNLIGKSCLDIPENPCCDQLKLGLRLYTNHLAKISKFEHPAPSAWNVLFGIRLSNFSGEICGLLKVRSLCFEP